MDSQPRDADARNDQQLIEAINRGDDEAFAALYRRYRQWVVALAYRFTADRDLALDVLQDTFVYVVKKFPGFELTANFKTFLYPAVKHNAMAAQRKARRYTSDPASLAEHVAADPPQDAQHEELAAMMACLSEDHREALLLRYVDGLSQQEIAGALGVPVGTVKSRLHHAIRQLRLDPRTRAYFEP